MVNVSRGKNEYGHHLLNLSLRSVHVCALTFRVHPNHVDSHTHTQIQCYLGKVFKIRNGRKGREKERQGEAVNRREVCNKNDHQTGERDNDYFFSRQHQMCLDAAEM